MGFENIKKQALYSDPRTMMSFKYQPELPPTSLRYQNHSSSDWKTTAYFNIHSLIKEARNVEPTLKEAYRLIGEGRQIYITN